MSDPPVCRCHDIPMYWAKDARGVHGGYWRCREKRKPLDAARWQGYYYERMPAEIWIPRRLQMRRIQAVARRRERQLRSV